MNVGVIDLETSMKPILHPWMEGAYLSTIGLRSYLDSGQANYLEWVYHHNEVKNTKTDQLQILFEVQEELDKLDMLVGHNVKFDLNWLKWYNISFMGKELWDTAIADYMLTGQNKELARDLSSCCQRFGVATKTDVVKSYWDAGRNTHTIPLKILLPYQKNDVDITAKLFKLQYAKMQTRKNLFRLARERMYVIHPVTEIECTGMNWDDAQAHHWVDHFKKDLENTDNKLKSYFGRDDINLGSGPELSACLYGGTLKREQYVPLVYTRNVTIKEPYKFTYQSGKMKGRTITKYKNRTIRELTCKKRKDTYVVTIPGIGFTPPANSNTSTDGVYQTNKDVLKNLTCGKTGGTSAKRKREVLELLNHRSKIGKFTSTFEGSKEDTGLFYNVGLNTDGIPHPSYTQTVTATSRFSSVNPNGQNFPRSKEDEDGFTNPLKSVFVPSRPGGLILVIDLSQLEWRVAAWLSQDPIAMQEIWDDVDCHLDNAIKFFGDAKYRQDAKIMTFRLLYGGSAYAFWIDPKMPNFSKQKWNEIVDGYKRKYAVLTQWQETNIAMVPQQNGFLFSPTGRMYKIPMAPHKRIPGVMIYKDTCIKNYPVQGTATGDIVPIAMNVMWDRMHAELYKYISTNWMGQVHDSMLFDTMPHEVKQVAFTGITVFEDLPGIVSNMFGVDFNVPLSGEAAWGPNYGKMTHSVTHVGGQWILKEKS